MAGDWIKMRVDLADDPAVIEMAIALDLDEFGIVGRLHKLWSWADKHCSDGHVKSVTNVWIDRYIGHTGFADAVTNVGWLAVTDVGIQFPKFTKHNGESAKSRIEAADRKRLQREKEKNDSIPGQMSQKKCDESVTREEKRREENKQQVQKAEAPAKRTPEASGTRLPNDWKPSSEDTEYCKTERPDLLPSKVAQNFYDYWIAKPGKDGRKTDWSATWRSWVRKEDSKAAGRSGGVPAQSLKWNPNSQDRTADAEFALAARKRLGIDGPDDGEEIEI